MDFHKEAQKFTAFASSHLDRMSYSPAAVAHELVNKLTKSQQLNLVRTIVYFALYYQSLNHDIDTHEDYEMSTILDSILSVTNVKENQ